jgi:CheY-like chemotaxis protein
LSVAATILVVDDDPDICRLLAVLLGRVGYRVVPAYDGSGALALARRERPDLILTDLAMPGMDGFALAARLRLTGFAEPIVLMSAGRAGSPMPEFPFVAKPFDVPRLLATIAAQLDLGRTTSGRPAAGSLLAAV